MAYSLGVVVAVVPPDWLPGCGLCSQHSCSQMHANVTSPRHHPAQQSTFASSSSLSTRFCLHFSVLILFVDMLLIGLLHYECTAFFTRLLTSRLPSFLFGAPLPCRPGDLLSTEDKLKWSSKHRTVSPVLCAGQCVFPLQNDRQRWPFSGSSCISWWWWWWCLLFFYFSIADQRGRHFVDKTAVHRHRHSTQLTVIGLIDVGWDGQCTRPYRRWTTAITSTTLLLLTLCFPVRGSNEPYPCTTHQLADIATVHGSAW